MGRQNGSRGQVTAMEGPDAVSETEGDGLEKYGEGRLEELTG